MKSFDILLFQMTIVIGAPLPGWLPPFHVTAEQNQATLHNARLPKEFADIG